MIKCANGIRSLSMLWIISLHVHKAGYSLFYNNPSSRDEYKHSFAATILYDLGYFAVDTFFALSGLLASMALLKEFDQNGRINPLRLYLRRYLRLTAPLAPVILLVVAFAEYAGEGPLWNPVVVGVYAESCKQYWWSALLHVQNYVNHSTVCLSWTWYVSVEMQLYILAPALIYPMWRWGKRALLCVGGLAVGGIIYVLVTFLVNDFRIADGLWKDLIYYPTHSRMAVWLVGAMFGYILHQTKNSKVNHLPKRYYALGWATCFAVLGLIVYATSLIAHTDPQEFSSLVDAFYESLSRPLFGTCAMWIIFACVNGHGGVVNDFLSSQLWQPLARLSYTMYLLHSVLLVPSLASVKTDSYFSLMDLWYRLCGVVGLTASVALVWSAVFEVPFGTLEKIALGRQ